MSVNKAILVGHVGQDPEVRYLEGGTCVANFSLATSETYKNKNGEKITNTEWHKIVVYRRLAEVVEKWVKKGSHLYIEGKIKTRTYDDKDGNKRYITEIYAENLQMLGKSSSGSDDKFKQQAEAAGITSQEKAERVQGEPSDPGDELTNPEEEDDLPFDVAPE